MSYLVLHLDENARRMSLPVLRKLAELIKDGAVVSGEKPKLLAGLADDPSEFAALVEEVWKPDTYQIYPDAGVAQVLSELAVGPDLDYTKPQEDSRLLYVHRKLDNTDIYWVNNRNDRNEVIEATFRVAGKVPQIWHPETGNREAAAYTMTDVGTSVTLNLTPNDAIFVVTIGGPWQVTFQLERGAPASATFDHLISYTEHSDPGIKYFSGTATYTQKVNIPESAIAEGTSLILDLGDVRNLAEVSVIGQPLGVIWKKPFRVAVTEALKVGENELEIKVVNLWVNRLIGDAQPDVQEKITYTTLPFYQADSPLVPAGLLGPVKIIVVNK